MGKKYELKRIEEEIWRQTPLEIREKKYRFSDLRDWIIKNDKSIERYNKKIKKLKSDNREWKKEKNKLKSELHSFQFDYHPSVSPTQQSSKNYQWSINLTIGGLKRKKYLGSNSKVREKVDEVKDIEIFLPKISDIRNDLMKECNEEVRKIIQRNLIKELEKDFDGINEKWKNDELKMWDYLY